MPVLSIWATLQQQQIVYLVKKFAHQFNAQKPGNIIIILTAKTKTIFVTCNI